MSKKRKFTGQKIPRNRYEFGGSLLLGKRRNRRPIQVNKSLHLVLRSDFAFGKRCLLRHRPLIRKVVAKASNRFRVVVFEEGIVSNHIHLHIKGKTRFEIQNFFRVVAGHIAQEILRDFPIRSSERPHSGGAPSDGAPGVLGPTKREKDNKFWQTRVYTRIVSWGRDFREVKNYVLNNTLEALGIIQYVT